MTVQGQTDGVHSSYGTTEKIQVDDVKQMGDQAMTQGRDVIDKLTTSATQNSKAMQELVMKAASTSTEFNKLILHNMQANTHAFYEALQAMAAAKSLPEAFRIQSQFYQTQMSALGEQSKRLTEISTKTNQEALKTIQDAAAAKNGSL